ncbi:MAG: diphthine--ammonia ligase [Methanomicrobiaceae archaeon]|nr:diphthine--ammonia ligase [Methanomicrobiaceae archaeon]
MSWAALTSGGKDSILAVQKALDSGRRVTTLLTVRPEDPDSYMFHSANLDAVPVIAKLAGMEYIEIQTHGRKEEELEDLEDGLSGLGIEGVVTGAVASEYQMSRIGAIAERLDLEVYAPLWHSDPVALLSEVAERLWAIIVVCAADGLDESFLGARIDAPLINRLLKVASRHHIHPAGEGGEYETLTLNAPFYSRPLTYRVKKIVRSPGRSELEIAGFS